MSKFNLISKNELCFDSSKMLIQSFQVRLHGRGILGHRLNVEAKSEKKNQERNSFHLTLSFIQIFNL